MGVEREDNLVELLDGALNDLTVQSHAVSHPWDANEYMRQVRLCTISYAPNVYDDSFLYIPDVGDGVLREQILSLIRTELDEYSNQGKIMSAAWYALGGPVLTGDYHDVLGALLRAAIAVGTRKAARRFLECVGEMRGYFQEIAIVNGVRICDNIQVFDGVQLVPFSSSSDPLPPYMQPLPLRGSSIDQFGRMLVVVNKSVSPVFAKPDYGPSSGRMPFEIRTESQECPDFDLAEFCQALALACGAAVQPAVDWRYMDEGEIFNTNHATSRILPYVQLSLHPLWLEQPIPVAVSNSGIDEAKALYISRSNLDAKTKAELSVPIDRWVKSKANRNDVDKAIDLGVAFESLYLRNDSPEITFRLSVSAALHLGEDRPERENIASELKDFYNLRSKAVHRGQFSKRSRSSATLKLIKRAEELCLRSLKKVIAEGHLPDTQSLVLGDR